MKVKTRGGIFLAAGLWEREVVEGNGWEHEYEEEECHPSEKDSAPIKFSKVVDLRMIDLNKEEQDCCPDEPPYASRIRIVEKGSDKTDGSEDDEQGEKNASDNPLSPANKRVENVSSVQLANGHQVQCSHE